LDRSVGYLRMFGVLASTAMLALPGCGRPGIAAESTDTSGSAGSWHQVRHTQLFENEIGSALTGAEAAGLAEGPAVTTANYTVTCILEPGIEVADVLSFGGASACPITFQFAAEPPDRVAIPAIHTLGTPGEAEPF